MKVDNSLGELVSMKTLLDSLIAKESDQEAIVSTKEVVIVCDSDIVHI